MIRPSSILNLIIAMMTILLILYLLARVSGTECFGWFDYGVSFEILFITMTANILAALGR